MIVTPNSRVTDFKYYYEEDSLALINSLISTFDTGVSIYDFDFKDESDGTRRLFDLMDMLLMKNDVVYIVDELERSLHPKLTEHFLELFSECHKQHKIQLVFTTHESAIMDQIRWIWRRASRRENT